MSDENKPKHLVSVADIPDEYKFCIEELKKNVEKFIETVGNIKLHPWQKEALKLIGNIKPVISMPMVSRFKSRFYYGQHLVAPPDFRKAIINNVIFDECKNLPDEYLKKFKKNRELFDVTFQAQMYGRFKRIKNCKNIVPRRQFKKWARKLNKRRALFHP